MLRWFALPAVALVACSSFSSSDPGGGTGTPDAAVAEGGAPLGEGGAPTDAAAPDSAAAPNLFLNGDFENGCGAWSGSYSTLTAVTDPQVAHSGSGVCLVCRTQSNAAPAIQQDVDLVARSGTYVFEAYLRSSAGLVDAGPVGTGIAASTYESFPDGGYTTYATTTGPALSATWQKITHVFVPGDLGSVKLHAILATITANDGDCFVIDDATLHAP